MNMLQRMKAAVLALAAGTLLVGAGPGPSDPWLEDFAAFKAGLAVNYANFEHLITKRRIDLPGIAERRQTQLQEATSDQARRAVFDEFVRNDLRDPHVRIEWAPERASTSAACPSDWAEQEARSGLRWERLAGFRALQGSATFRAGLYRASNGRTLGVVRIGLFSERAFPEPCTRAAAELGIDADAPCDELCEARLERRAGQRAAQVLAHTLRRLEAAGAERIVLDLTNNSGGSDWVEAALRVVGGDVAPPGVGMLKHPAWRLHLGELRSRLRARLPDARGAEREALRVHISRLDEALRQLNAACDLSAAWSDRDLAMGLKAPPCSSIVHGVISSTGMTPFSGSATELGEAVDVSLRYSPYPKGATSLPVLVLVHDNTHSAAELFAAALDDAGRARIVGSTTPGAGCGQFTKAGTSFRLPNSGALVHLPDCTRRRADGTDERDGVVPDVFVPWGPADSAFQWTSKAAEVLSSL